MGKELYTWEQVRAYGEIALHNLTKSANEINMRNFKKVHRSTTNFICKRWSGGNGRIFNG